MDKTLFQTAQRENFLKSLREYRSKGLKRMNDSEANNNKR
jgi:hypothetical protein